MARQVFLLQAASLLALVAVVFGVLAWDARDKDLASARARCIDIAQTVALSEIVTSHTAAHATSPALQAYADAVRSATDTDFVVVMGLDRSRLTHPSPDQIGQAFRGDVGDAPTGGVFTQEYAGTLGPSVRAVVPVRAASGDVVGLVSVGILIGRLESGVPLRVAIIAAIAAALLAAGGLGAWLISRRLNRQTRGLDAAALAQMHEFYDSLLHAVREGLLILDPSGSVQLANDEAGRLLGLPEDSTGRPITEVGLPDDLASQLLHRSVGGDELVLVGDRVLVVNQRPASYLGRDTGSVVTLRDHTDLQRIGGELATVRGLTETLRAQNHEAANRLHTVVSLIEMGQAERAVEFVTGTLVTAQHLTDQLAGASDEPVCAALLLGKSAQASERGIDFSLDVDSRVDGLPLPETDAVSILGNLIDNALDAVAGRPEPRVEVLVCADSASFRVEVEDSGPGIPPEARADVLRRGWTTKADAAGHGLGLALVAQIVSRHGGRLELRDSGLGGVCVIVDIEGAA